MNRVPTIHTVGHSNHPFDFFLELIEKGRIEQLIDVRSQPHSRRYPHYCYKDLGKSLQSHNIHYRFAGRELGGRPKEKQYYDALGNPDYERIRASNRFQMGIKGLIVRAGALRTAIMCSEEDPNRCHRGFLISPVMVGAGFEVLHLRGDGRIEPYHGLAAGSGPQRTFPF